MKITVEIDSQVEDIQVYIKAKERDAQLEKLLEKIKGDRRETDFILAYDEDGIVPLRKEDIYYFYTQEKKVYVSSKKGVYEVRQRLYELEEAEKDFLRISNTEIVKIQEIEKIDLKYSGTILMIMKNKEELYVSRRYMGKVKEAFGLGGKK